MRSVYLMVGPWRIFTISNTLAQCSSLGIVLHSLVCNPAVARGVKYCCIQRAGFTRRWFIRSCSTDERSGGYESPLKAPWRSLKMTVSVAFYTTMRINCATTAPFPSYMLTGSSKESSTGLATLSGVLKVSLSETPFCPYRLLPGDDELEANRKKWATTLKENLEPLPGQRVFGCACLKRHWVNSSSELARDRRTRSALIRNEQYRTTLTWDLSTVRAFVNVILD